MDSKSDPGAPPPGATAAPKRGADRRSGKERRRDDKGVAAGTKERRLAERRTGLDRRRPHLHYDEMKPHPRPERNINDYPLSTDEVEFINAINDYKSKFNRPFPTWSEILHVLRTLGYVRTFEFPFPIPAEGGPFDPPPPTRDPAPPAPAGNEGGQGGKGGAGESGG
jgi:hypothetical protein